MDPNEALRRLRELAKDVQHTAGCQPDVATEMAELFEALDQWICKQGCLPIDWYNVTPE